MKNGVRVPDADFAGIWSWEGDFPTVMQDAPFWRPQRAFFAAACRQYRGQTRADQLRHGLSALVSESKRLVALFPLVAGYSGYECRGVPSFAA
jgi:hypothetical protein